MFLAKTRLCEDGARAMSNGLISGVLALQQDQ
jgi:hypothetical protein